MAPATPATALQGEGAKTTLVPVAVQLEVSRHLPVRHRVWGLLQLQDLEVHTLALIWHYEVGVQRALWAAGLLPAQRDQSGKAAGTQEPPREPPHRGDSGDKPQSSRPSERCPAAEKGSHTGPNQRLTKPSALSSTAAKRRRENKPKTAQCLREYSPCLPPLPCCSLHRRQRHRLSDAAGRPAL